MVWSFPDRIFGELSNTKIILWLQRFWNFWVRFWSWQQAVDGVLNIRVRWFSGCGLVQGPRQKRRGRRYALRDLVRQIMAAQSKAGVAEALKEAKLPPKNLTLVLEFLGQYCALEQVKWTLESARVRNHVHCAACTYSDWQWDATIWITLWHLTPLDCMRLKKPWGWFLMNLKWSFLSVAIVTVIVSCCDTQDTCVCVVSLRCFQQQAD